MFAWYLKSETDMTRHDQAVTRRCNLAVVPLYLLTILKKVSYVIIFTQFDSPWLLISRHFATGKPLQDLISSVCPKIRQEVANTGDKPVNPKILITLLMYNILSQMCFGKRYLNLFTFPIISDNRTLLKWMSSYPHLKLKRFGKISENMNEIWQGNMKSQLFENVSTQHWKAILIYHDGTCEQVGNSPFMLYSTLHYSWILFRHICSHGPASLCSIL